METLEYNINDFTDFTVSDIDIIKIEDDEIDVSTQATTSGIEKSHIYVNNIWVLSYWLPQICVTQIYYIYKNLKQLCYTLVVFSRLLGVIPPLH